MKPRVRSAVDQILAFNRRFPRAQLQGKPERMTASHFTFFRATFHLFAYDLRDGWCRDWPLANVEGRSSVISIRKISVPIGRLRMRSFTTLMTSTKPPKAPTRLT